MANKQIKKHIEVTCPKCGKEITILSRTIVARCDVTREFEVRLDKNQQLDENPILLTDEERDDLDYGIEYQDTIQDAYFCPLCNEELIDAQDIDGEERAFEFLKTGILKDAETLNEDELAEEQIEY